MKRKVAHTFVLLACFFLLPPSGAQASSMFENLTLEGHKGPYLVKKNKVNVRNKPANKGKKLKRLEKRDIIEVLGRVKGTQWMATKRGGEELGFVFAHSLTPMINASFETPLVGRIDLTNTGKPECTYEVTYEGRAVEEEIVFVAADYLAHFKCQSGFDIFGFDAMMFMSEIPHDLGLKPVFQITMDLPEIATGYEEFLSATALYHLEDEKVVMDAVSLKAFKEKDLRESLPASSIPKAIEAAMTLHLNSFNKKAWDIISGKIPNPGGIKEE